MKRPQLSSSKVLFLLLVILPVILITIYEYAFASNRYESTAAIYITEENAQSSPFDLTLLGITSAGSSRDILVLKAFIESPRLLAKINKDTNLRDHFSNPSIDFWSKLAKDASREEYHEYYMGKVLAEFDDEAQLLKISVQTFDPIYSKKVIKAILQESQTFIDRLNENISKSQLNFFEKQVKESEIALTKARTNLRAFQKKNNFLSTEVSTSAIVGTISALEQAMAQKKSELNSRFGLLGVNSPTLRRLRAEIKALKEQIQRENNRLAGGKAGSLSDLDSTFRELMLLVEFKALRYKANLDALEKAQTEAARRLRFLTIVSPPTLADESLYPNRPYIIMTTAIIALMLYFIASITLATIREHA